MIDVSGCGHAAGPAEDVVLTVRFDLYASPRVVEVEVEGEEQLSSAGLLEVVEAAALRLAVFAAEFRMAALLDRIASSQAAEQPETGCRTAVDHRPCGTHSPSAAARTPTAHLGGGAKQDKGGYSWLSYQRRS